MKAKQAQRKKNVANVNGKHKIMKTLILPWFFLSFLCGPWPQIIFTFATDISKSLMIFRFSTFCPSAQQLKCSQGN